MAKTYKVWIEIEEFDEDTCQGQEMDAPGANVATFDDYDEAYRFAELLTGAADAMRYEEAKS